LGIEVHHVNGPETLCKCPFCGDPKHLSVNAEKRVWRCLKCQPNNGRSGGSLLDLVMLRGRKKPEAIRLLKRHGFWRDDGGSGGRTTGLTLAALAKAKRVSEKSLRQLGAREVKGGVVFPMVVGGEVVGYLYRGPGGTDRVMSPSLAFRGGRLGLIIPEGVTGDEPVTLCEGPTDCAAALDAGLNAVAAPSASTFKSGWAAWFKGRDVRIVPDLDKPGQRWARNVVKKLAGVARSVMIVRLPGEIKGEHGADLREFLLDGGSKEAFEQLCRPDEPAKPKIEAPPLTLTEAKKVYHKWLELDDDRVIDVVFADIVANRLPGDPLWMFIVAAPGGCKTEIIRSLSASPEVYAISDLTPNTLISGALNTHGDPSLLPRLHGRVLAIKDFTTILTKRHDDRQEILGQLRDAYDGEAAKTFGTGETRSYKAHFAILAGVTPAIDAYTSVGAQLGERFLRYRLAPPSDLDQTVLRAIDNASHEPGMREELQRAALGVLARIPMVPAVPQLPEDMKRIIAALARLVALCRSTVARDGYTREIKFVPAPEVGTRLGKQLVKLGYGLAIVRGVTEVGGAELATLRKVAVDTIPSRSEAALRKLWEAVVDSENADTGAWRSTRGIGEQMGWETDSVRRVLEDFHALGIVERRGSRPFEWRLADENVELIRTSGVYAPF